MWTSIGIAVLLFSVARASAGGVAGIEDAGTTYLLQHVFSPNVTFDRYDIRVAGRYAVVRYAHRNAAGTMLLAKSRDGWGVVINGGGGMSAEILQTAGVPPADAPTLLQPCPPRLRSAAAVPASLRSRFASTKQGTTRVPNVTRCRG